MLCPSCRYPQKCDCAACEEFLDDYEPQIEVQDDILACPNCGFTAHIDWWEEYSMREFYNEHS